MNVQQDPYGDSGSASVTGADTQSMDSSLSSGDVLGSGGTSDPLASSSGSDSNDTKETAKQEAANVKDKTTEAVSQVSDTAKDQVQQVTADVREQTRQLATETKTQLSDQAMTQRDRAVDLLRSFGGELQKMSSQTGDSSEFEKLSSQSEGDSGMARQLVTEASDWTNRAADFLEQRDPSQLMDELRGVARRRPGAFLAGAAVAGVVVGRLTRGAMAARSDDDSQAYSSAPRGYPVASSATYPGPAPAAYAPIGDPDYSEAGYSEVAGGPDSAWTTPAVGTPPMGTGPVAPTTTGLSGRPEGSA